MKTPAVEMGVLDSIFISQIDFNRVYVVVNNGEDSYMATLRFEEPKVAQAVYDFLCLKWEIASNDGCN